MLVFDFAGVLFMQAYRPRLVDAELQFRLEAKGAVLVEGSKWCGKTTTALQQAGSVLRVDDSAQLDQYRSLAQLNPARLLQGQTPRLLDEWQVLPQLWDAARREVDQRGETGQFIFTGSAVPPDTSQIVHSGTGRFAWLRMRTMSLFESGESSGEVSLERLFAAKNSPVDGTNDLDLDALAFLTCRGGWPQAIKMSARAGLAQSFDYLDGVVNSDINRVDGVSRDPQRVRRLLRSYARFQGASVPYTSIQADLATNETDSFSADLVSAYALALRQIFVIEDVPAWNPNLRSSTAIRTSDTRYFTDSSIATAALGLGPNDLIGDLNTFGLIFETLCLRDLRVYAQSLDGQVYHYRDRNGLECDAVIHLRDGRYGLIEIKLGGTEAIDQGAHSLKTLRGKLDTGKMKPPAFLMVLIGVGDYAYRREDGVLVVPIGTLRP